MNGNHIDTHLPRAGYRICQCCIDGKVERYGKKIDCECCKGDVMILIREKSYCENFCVGFGSWCCYYPKCPEFQFDQEDQKKEEVKIILEDITW